MNEYILIVSDTEQLEYIHSFSTILSSKVRLFFEKILRG